MRKRVSGGQQTSYHLTPPRKGLVTRRTQQQYVFSGADGGSVDEQFYGVRQIPVNFRVGRARRKTGRDTPRWRKIAEPSRFVTSCEVSYSTPTGCLSDCAS